MPSAGDCPPLKAQSRWRSAVFILLPVRRRSFASRHSGQRRGEGIRRGRGKDASFLAFCHDALYGVSLVTDTAGRSSARTWRGDGAGRRP